MEQPFVHWRQLWESMLPEINPGLYMVAGGNGKIKKNQKKEDLILHLFEETL